MKILIRIVGRDQRPTVFPFPDGWPVPRVGEGFSSLECYSGTVMSVSHYPSGEHEDGKSISDPFIYVVVYPDE